MAGVPGPIRRGCRHQQPPSAWGCWVVCAVASARRVTQAPMPRWTLCSDRVLRAGSWSCRIAYIASRLRRHRIRERRCPWVAPPTPPPATRGPVIWRRPLRILSSRSEPSRPARSHPARTRGARVGDRRLDPPANRLHAVHRPAHRGGPSGTHPIQVRRADPYRSGDPVAGPQAVRPASTGRHGRLTSSCRSPAQRWRRPANSPGPTSRAQNTRRFGSAPPCRQGRRR